MTSPLRVCTINVRAGSKGVPGKNWRMIAGLPLFAHSLRQALDSGLFERIGVSSDAPEVLDTAASFGATDVIVRPPALATDEAGKVPAIVHGFQQIEERTGAVFDTLVDLDATSPLRTPEDIVGAVAMFEEGGADSVITGCEARRSPYFNLVEQDASTGGFAVSKRLPAEVLRRQDAPRTFDMNGSVYVWRRDALYARPNVFYPSTRLYEMPAERSVDIDSELDFTFVKWLMER